MTPKAGGAECPRKGVYALSTFNVRRILGFLCHTCVISRNSFVTQVFESPRSRISSLHVGQKTHIQPEKFARWTASHDTVQPIPQLPRVAELHTMVSVLRMSATTFSMRAFRSNDLVRNPVFVKIDAGPGRPLGQLYLRTSVRIQPCHCSPDRGSARQCESRIREPPCLTDAGS